MCYPSGVARVLCAMFFIGFHYRQSFASVVEPDARNGILLRSEPQPSHSAMHQIHLLASVRTPEVTKTRAVSRGW
jgi:hypothetical protein